MGYKAKKHWIRPTTFNVDLTVVSLSEGSIKADAK